MTYLYLIREVGLPYYKVGIAGDPNERLRSLQTGNSSKLALIRKWPFRLRIVAKRFESEIHRVHNESRKQGGTEWFHLDDDDLDELIAYLDHPSLIEAEDMAERQEEALKAAPWIMGVLMVVLAVGKEVFKAYANKKNT